MSRVEAKITVMEDLMDSMLNLFLLELYFIGKEVCCRGILLESRQGLCPRKC